MDFDPVCVDDCRRHEFQFTAPSRELRVANRDLGTVEHVNSNGDLRIRMDSDCGQRQVLKEYSLSDHRTDHTGRKLMKTECKL